MQMKYLYEKKNNSVVFYLTSTCKNISYHTVFKLDSEAHHQHYYILSLAIILKPNTVSIINYSDHSSEQNLIKPPTAGTDQLMAALSMQVYTTGCNPTVSSQQNYTVTSGTTIPAPH